MLETVKHLGIQLKLTKTHLYIFATYFKAISIFSRPKINNILIINDKIKVKRQIIRIDKTLKVKMYIKNERYLSVKNKTETDFS